MMDTAVAGNLLIWLPVAASDNIGLTFLLLSMVGARLGALLHLIFLQVYWLWLC